MGSGRHVIFGPDATYFRFVREERYFCAVLAHLLMQRSENVRELLTLISERLEGGGLPPIADLQMAQVEEAEVYLEFAFLRDLWNRFDLDEKEPLSARNAKKRAFIFDLLGRVESLASLQPAKFPGQVPEFNAKFMGDKRGRQVRQDIVSPALWSVEALLSLANSFGTEEAERKKMFRDLCKFKWAFRIKPDMVIILPSVRPICVEAKLMSPEGHYPTNATEAKLFDERFQQPEHRVRQVELQDFMFRVLLQSGAHHVLIGRGHEVLTMPGDDGQSVKVPVLSWKEVFDWLDCSSSSSSVARFLRENAHIQDTPLLEPGGGSAGAVAGSYFDGVANGLEAILVLIAQRQQERLRTEIGFDGGRERLAERTLESLFSRKWKWRDPAANAGPHQPANWIEATEFERIIEQLRREQA